VFWDSRKEEETFRAKIKKGEKSIVKTEKLPEPDVEEVLKKLNKITEQVNLMSRYLSYLSEKFDKTIDSAIAYDRGLDDIESRINLLRSRIEEMEIASPSVGLGEKSGKRAV